MSHLDPLSSLIHVLNHEQIIPDVLPASFIPSVLLSIVYPNGKEVLQGNTLRVEETLDEPAVNFVPLNLPTEHAGNPGEENSQEVGYTLVMFDPDAPSRADPKFKSFRHWIITGLKLPHTAGTTSGINALKTNPSTTPYRPPGPRVGSGFHRYVFLLFEEPISFGHLSVPQSAPEHGVSLEARRCWDPLAFGQAYGLALVGVNHFFLRSTE